MVRWIPQFFDPLKGVVLNITQPKWVARKCALVVRAATGVCSPPPDLRQVFIAFAAPVPRGRPGAAGEFSLGFGW